VPSSPNPFRFRLDFPPELPISSRAEEIVAAIQQNQVVILAGETGSGKTTQIPKMCLAAGGGQRGRIACTQPRRVAALSISRRVAEELGVEWGREVGCKVRFSDQTSADTRIKFLTDGMLLAEVQGDPQLRGYDTIILDEAHERSLNIDFLLGHLRNLRFLRPELKIIVTSATIDTQAFSEAFDGAPVIQVSGRTYPVETIYSPLDEMGNDAASDDEPDARAEALHYVDGAVEAVLRVLDNSDTGDLLVFFPSERDIREAMDLLDGRKLGRCELVPLFGRLSNTEQQRVFASSQRRKIVLATNIAETSLTIPGIRYVIDTGLARLSRYSPQARTRRLPIEPVAQSSADQRKGRAGRVAEGVCIRLYSEKDYLERPRFTQPEIQRANLADVILRLKAYGLGDIERFPFINPPATKAIRAGYALLEELGALTPPASEGDVRQLTPLGRELARLPVDPTVGRMILQARTEKCLREALIIAAGLSIQDPRERPLDKQREADTAHRRFAHRDSDFLTLLNIWESYHDEFATMAPGKLRKFCRTHFLSYVRMREWRDIHVQLLDVLESRDGFKMTSAYNGLKTVDEKTTAFGTPAYRAIHRSVLSGLLGNIAEYDEENRLYKAPHDRKVVLFPGSVLFSREEPKKRRSDEPGRPAPRKDNKVPRWIMASEIVETTRVFARTCARIDPVWALDLGAHLVRVSHSEPFWNPDSGRVMVKSRTRLYGLEIEVRSVGYGRVNAVHATEIFIREALVNDTVTWPFDFLAHNRRVREKIEFSLTRMRDSGYLNLDEALYRFYAARLLPENASAEPQNADEAPAFEGVSSVPELVDLVRDRRANEPDFLMLEPEDLRDPESLAHDATAFPESLPLTNRVLELNYAYKPGQTDDGVTLDVPVRDVPALTPAALDWAVPGYTGEKVTHYLKSLPKDLRRAFVPLAETAAGVTQAVEQLSRLRGGKNTLVELLAEHLRDRFGLRFDARVWDDKPLPEHLVVRVRVVDAAGKEICASRNLAELQASLEEKTREAGAVTTPRGEPEIWRRARAKWEKAESAEWIFGDVPASVPVGDQAGVPVTAFPALVAGKVGVALRLMHTPEEAAKATRAGLRRMFELQLGRDLGWFQRDLKSLRQLGALSVLVRPLELLQEDAFLSLQYWLCGPAVSPLTEARFKAALDEQRCELRGLLPKLLELLREILSLRQSLVTHPTPYDGLPRELEALVPADFVRTTPYAQLAHFSRYLRAMKLRADRWKQQPAKDAERAKRFAPYARATARLERTDRRRWLVEELRVSVFAQELGTAESVSEVKLDRLLAGGAVPMEDAFIAPPVAAKPAPVAPATPPPVQSEPARKATSLKSFGALGNLLRK